MGRPKKQNQPTKKSSSTKGKPKLIQNLLTLAEKISVINEYEQIGNVGKLATMYRCNPGQIQNIWRRKNEFLKEWANKSVKESINPEPDQTVLLTEAVREWIRRCKSRGLRVYDSRITHTAMEIAKLMKIKNVPVKVIKELIEVNKLEPLPLRIRKKSRISLKLSDVLFEAKETLSKISTLKMARTSIRKPKKNRTVIEEDVINDHEEDTLEFHLSTIVKEEEQIMDDSIDIIEMKNNEVQIISVKEEQVDMIPVKNEQLCEEEDITSYKEALYCLEILGDFALVKEDFRAISVINQLQKWFSEQMTLNP